jgi:hypothetical protein
VRKLLFLLALALAPASASAASCRVTAYRAPADGYLTARSPAGFGDWDLALRSGGRVLQRSLGFGSSEVVQGWVRRGQRVRVSACARRGAHGALPVRLDVLRVGPPTADQVALVQGMRLTPHTAELIAADRAARRADARVTAPSALPSGRTTYRSYADYQAELKALADANPTLTRAVTLPRKTVQGRDIQGIEIAENAARPDDGRPVSVIVALHHAREWPSAEVAMEFARDLVDRFRGRDPRITTLLHDVRVLVVPVLNVDGFLATQAAGADTTLNPGELPFATAGIASFRRKNCAGPLPAGAPCELQHGVDNNRNYGNSWGGYGTSDDPSSQIYHGPAPWSEPETAAFHELTQRLPVASVATIHNNAHAIYEASDTSGDAPVPDAMALD